MFDLLYLLRLVATLVVIYLIFKLVAKYYVFRSSELSVYSYNIGGGFDSLWLEIKWKAIKLWEKYRVFIIFLGIGIVLLEVSSDFWLNIISFAFAANEFFKNKEVFEVFSSNGYRKNEEKLKYIEHYLWRHYKEGCFENYSITMKRHKNSYRISVNLNEYSVKTEKAKTIIVELIKEAAEIAGIEVESIDLNVHKDHKYD